MSRVGKLAVTIPSDVNVSLNGSVVVIKGKLGELKYNLTDDVKFEIVDGKVQVNPANDSKKSRAMWGTVRNNINNMIKGVTAGFSIRLVINGVGYRAASDNKFISLALGFSHDIKYAIPEGVAVKCEKPTLVVISGPDRQKIGQIAGDLMKLRPAEPYKGKGIFPENSYIRRKEGKKK